MTGRTLRVNRLKAPFDMIRLEYTLNEYLLIIFYLVSSKYERQNNTQKLKIN